MDFKGNVDHLCFPLLNIYILQLDDAKWRNKKTQPSGIRVIWEYFQILRSPNIRWTNSGLRQSVLLLSTLLRLTCSRLCFRAGCPQCHNTEQKPFSFPVFNNLTHSKISLVLITWTWSKNTTSKIEVNFMFKKMEKWNAKFCVSMLKMGGGGKGN